MYIYIPINMYIESGGNSQSQNLPVAKITYRDFRCLWFPLSGFITAFGGDVEYVYYLLYVF